MLKTLRPNHAFRGAFILWAGAHFVASAHAVENSRLVQFNGQTIPAPASTAVVTSADGAMSISPMVAGNGLNFPAVQSYGLNAPGSPTGTTFTITPSSSAVPHRIGVSDQRTSSTQFISAKCLNPSTQALDTCDLSDVALYPRTFNPPSGGAYFETANVQWDSPNQRLVVTTPGPSNLNIQSNGFFIDLPPYVREVTFRATNFAGVDSIFGFMAVADAPSVSKGLSSTSIQPGGQTTLTINLKNPDLGAPVPGVNLTDVLPAPLRVVSATHSCAGGTLASAAGSTTISLSGATLPTDGCAITAVLEWPSDTAGIAACVTSPTVTNRITPPAQFSTAIGQLNTEAVADLSCSYTPPVVNVACTTSELFDSPNQQSVCTITSSTPAGSSGLNVNLTAPGANPRYTSDCLASITIPAAQTSAQCTITATANTVPGDGDVTATLAIAAASNVNDYTIGVTPAQVVIKNDDEAVVTPPQAVPTLGEWPLVMLASVVAMLGATRVRRREI